MGRLHALPCFFAVFRQSPAFFDALIIEDPGKGQLRAFNILGIPVGMMHDLYFVPVLELVGRYRHYIKTPAEGVRLEYEVSRAYADLAHHRGFVYEPYRIGRVGLKAAGVYPYLLLAVPYVSYYRLSRGVVPVLAPQVPRILVRGLGCNGESQSSGSSKLLYHRSPQIQGG